MAGSLMKAEIRPGGGDARPSDGDQVINHCTVRTLAGVVVQSTRSEYGGEFDSWLGCINLMISFE